MCSPCISRIGFHSIKKRYNCFNLTIFKSIRDVKFNSEICVCFKAVRDERGKMYLYKRKLGFAELGWILNER